MNSAFEQGAFSGVLARLGSPQDVLERHGFDPRRHRCLCPNPVHQDRRPGSLSFYTSRRTGKDRLHCHSCGLDEDAIGVARLLGEPVFRWPERSPEPRRRPKTGTERTLLKILQNKSSGQVVVAKTLARLDKQAASCEIARNWEYLAGFGSIGGMIELADGLRPYMLERFGVPADFCWSRDQIDRGLAELANDR